MPINEYVDRVPVDPVTGALNVNIVGGDITIGDITVSGIEIGDGDDTTQGSKADPAYAGSGDATVIAALKGIYDAVLAGGGGGGGGGAVTIGDGDDITTGATADNMVAAGAVGTISAKLRRATQGLEDLKTNIVLAAGANRIGKVTVRNAANSADIDPLADATFTGRVGEVQDTPTSNTVLDRLKTVGINTGSTVTALGEVQTTPTANTVLDRLKTLNTSVVALTTTTVLAAGANRIGKVTIRNSANGADIDPLADATFTGVVGTTGDTAWNGSDTNATVIAALKALYAVSPTTAIADGADVALGATGDSIVAAGAAGTVSAKLRRATQGLEDLKTGIVLAAGSNRIGKTTIRNAANSADIDPLADATFTGSVGEVQASPTANTVLDRLKTVGTNTGSAVTALGEVQASPTANTVLDRLKTLNTSVVALTTTTVLAAGANRIGKVTIRNSANGADIDPLADSTFTDSVGEVQTNPTTNTVLDRLKTVGTNTGTISSNSTSLVSQIGEVQATPTTNTVLDRLKAIGTNTRHYGNAGAPTSAVSVTDTATELLATNSSRLSAIISNNGYQTIYLGSDSSVDLTNGIPLAAQSSLVDARTRTAWYGIAAAGAVDVRVIEVT